MLSRHQHYSYICQLPNFLYHIPNAVLQYRENLHIKTIANTAYMLRLNTPHDAFYVPGRYAGAHPGMKRI
jgi:hypothetical protein